ncbi:MAG: hypothetical protein U0836_12450 [Pirellulales bacterium]
MFGDILLHPWKRPLSLIESDRFDEDGLWLGGVICLYSVKMEQRAAARGAWSIQVQRLRAAATNWLLAPIGFPMQTHGQ